MSSIAKMEVFTVSTSYYLPIIYSEGVNQNTSGTNALTLRSTKQMKTTYLFAAQEARDNLIINLLVVNAVIYTYLAITWSI